MTRYCTPPRTSKVRCATGLGWSARRHGFRTHEVGYQGKIKHTKRHERKESAKPVNGKENEICCLPSAFES